MIHLLFFPPLTPNKTDLEWGKEEEDVSLWGREEEDVSIRVYW